MASHNRTTYRYEPDVVYPPGDTLQELLDERGLTQHELATRTDLSTKHINQLIKGAVALTPETALRLERALGTPAHVWNNLESAYHADMLRVTPAAVRFLSLEPLLEPLPSLNLTRIDWVIVGGESGPSARPMHPDWVRDIRDGCIRAGIPFFFKQWGAWIPDDAGPMALNVDGALRTANQAPESWQRVRKVGKKKAGRVLDGRTWDEMPEDRNHA